MEKKIFNASRWILWRSHLFQIVLKGNNRFDSTPCRFVKATAQIKASFAVTTGTLSAMNYEEPGSMMEAKLLLCWKYQTHLGSLWKETVCRQGAGGLFDITNEIMLLHWGKIVRKCPWMAGWLDTLTVYIRLGESLGYKRGLRICGDGNSSCSCNTWVMIDQDDSRHW